MRTGKHIALTPRDLEIFRALSRYRYLRSTCLHAFAGGASETRFKERLGDLFHEGYIDRPQWQFADALHAPVVYELGEGAKRVLQERGESYEAYTFLSQTAHRQFAHSAMICACLASFELATRQREGVRFIPWPEILARAPEATRASAMPFRLPMPTGGIVPDGLFGLEYCREGKKSYRFFALEADRGTMPIMRSKANQTSYLGKIVAYREIIARAVYKSHLGVPNLLVLTITSGEPRLNEMLSRLHGENASGAAFLFTAVSAHDLTTPRLCFLNELWKRADLPPLRIDA